CGGPIVFLGVLVHTRLDHFVLEVVAFARALAYAGKHRIAAVRLRNVVDQLHDDDGLSDAGAADHADLAAFRVGRQQIDDLDARNENFRFRRLVGKGRRRLVDRAPLIVRNGTGLIDGIADHVDDAPQRAVTDGHRDGLARVRDLLTAHEAFARIHGDGAYRRLAEMLGHLEHQAMVLILRLERVENGRQMPFEMHVDDRADHLRHVPDWIGHGWSLL